MKTHFLIFFAGLFWTGNMVAQCCSPGNPVGGTASVGTVQKGSLRSITFFRHSFSDTFYDETKEAEFQDTKASFNYLGQTLGYGLTDRLTIEAELGLFINKTRRSELAGEEIGRGWSNALASIKYSLWKDKLRDWELTTGVGVRFPFSRNLKEDSDGYPLSMDVQPSTGTTGFVGQFFLYKGFIPQGWRFFLLNRIELYGINDIGYQYGKANYTSFFVSRRLNLHWTAILQVRNEWRDYDYWEDILLANTGSNVVFLAPQINLNLAQKWNISLLAELPVLRSYHHSQLGAKYAFALNIIRDFDLAERELLKKE